MGVDPRYVAARLVYVVPTLLAIVTINFIIIHVAPGDPAALIVGEFAMTPEVVENARREFGLDQPLYVQYLKYVGNLARGEFGYSYWYKEPVLSLIVDHIPATAELMLAALLISLLLGTAGGLLAGRYRGRLFDQVATVAALVGYSAPVFWIGLLFILFFAFHLGLFPLQGAASPAFNGSTWDVAVDRLRHLVLPALTLATAELAAFFRFARGRAVEESLKEYVVVARSKGVSERSLLGRHVLPNILPTMITLTGLRLGTVFAGAVLTETTFAWPGIGRLMFEAIQHRDYPLVMGVFVLSGTLVVIANLLTDLAYGLVDPRIRYS